MAIKKETKIKIYMTAGLLIVLALLFWFALSGDNGALVKSMLRHDLSREELQELLRDFGWRGYITITVLALLQVICAVLPAEPVQVLAGLTFGFPVGLLCCFIGVFLANTIIYLLQRTYGDSLRDFFMKKLHLDLDKIAHSNKSTVIIFILYFLPAIPYGMIAFFAAGIGMRYRRFIAVTMLGALPSVCIGVGLGYMTIVSDWVVSVCVFAVLVVLLIVMFAFRNKIFAKINNYADKPGYSAKTKVRPCNRLLFGFLYRAVRVYYFLGGIRIKTTTKAVPETPSIVLCNHGSFIDFVYAGALLHKQHPHFVAARLYFYHKWLGRILKLLGSFPKSMFAMDTESTKNCLKVLANGEMLAMMPEARLSTVGRFEDIQDTTFSFLKKAEVPIYTIHMKGDYFANPKWGTGIRRGARVEATLDILFTADQVRELTVDEIKQGVEQRLYYDEWEWIKTRPDVQYRARRLAEGLENILTVCPICGGRHTITTKGHDIFCERCGKLTSLDNRYHFAPDFRFAHFGEWYDWQKSLIEKEVDENPDFALISDVELRVPSNGDALTRHAGHGTCTLDRTGLTYVGTKDGEAFEIHFSIERVYRLLFGAGENFEIYNGAEILYFVPDERRSAVDWYMTSTILNNRAAQAKTV